MENDPAGLQRECLTGVRDSSGGRAGPAGLQRWPHSTPRDSSSRLTCPAGLQRRSSRGPAGVNTAGSSAHQHNPAVLLYKVTAAHRRPHRRLTSTLQPPHHHRPHSTSTAQPPHHHRAR
ncbi:unnamed protein product, partial [Mycena citricolor]